ncbi:hypothetical protein VCRA2120O333_20071 [Vibrio crassostreae]|nr:hypothetical protein VCRA2121O334_20072 [Vibrio crassostreae]CAK3854114.1 hypothetical protein VCRA2120O333_20071 [Vibrio crassostreae]
MSGFAAETSRAIEGSGKVSNVLDSRLQFSPIESKLILSLCQWVSDSVRKMSPLIRA